MRAQGIGARKKSNPTGTAITSPRIVADTKPFKTNAQDRRTENHWE